MRNHLLFSLGPFLAWSVRLGLTFLRRTERAALLKCRAFSRRRLFAPAVARVAARACVASTNHAALATPFFTLIIRGLAVIGSPAPLSQQVDLPYYETVPDHGPAHAPVPKITPHELYRSYDHVRSHLLYAAHRNSLGVSKAPLPYHFKLRKYLGSRGFDHPQRGLSYVSPPHLQRSLLTPPACEVRLARLWLAYSTDLVPLDRVTTHQLRRYVSLILSVLPRQTLFLRRTWSIFTGLPLRPRRYRFRAVPLFSYRYTRALQRIHNYILTPPLFARLQAAWC